MRGLITQRQIKDQYDTECDILEKSYISFFEGLGFELAPVSNFQNINFNADFLVLTGGGNIYGEQPDRDRQEEKLFKQALVQRKPILGICRGMQYINLLLDGGLTKNAKLSKERPNREDHAVEIKNKLYTVNNFHNDVIFKNDLSQKLAVLAQDIENNTIEAFYSDDLKILGLQWHPERNFKSTEGKEFSEKLIKDFLTYGEIK